MQHHWDEVYAGSEIEETGWYEAEPTVSLSLIDHCELAPEEAILDVGAGASSLVGELQDRGFRDLTVLDISANALDRLRTALGEERAARIRFVRADVTDPAALEIVPPLQLWHDRAMLHFLTEERDCERYAEAVRAAVAPEGYVILATYALHGAPT